MPRQESASVGWHITLLHLCVHVYAYICTVCTVQYTGTYMCASLSVHDLPPCAATLKQGHAMVLSHQGHDPVMVVTLVLAVSVITGLEAKVRYRKYGTVQ